jgi:hypothetical protein
VRSREHWLIGPDLLYVVVKNDVHHVAFHSIATIVRRTLRPRLAARRPRA